MTKLDFANEYRKARINLRKMRGISHFNTVVKQTIRNKNRYNLLNKLGCMQMLES